MSAEARAAGGKVTVARSPPVDGVLGHERSPAESADPSAAGIACNAREAAAAGAAGAGAGAEASAAWVRRADAAPALMGRSRRSLAAPPAVAAASPTMTAITAAFLPADGVVVEPVQVAGSVPLVRAPTLCASFGIGAPARLAGRGPKAIRAIRAARSLVSGEPNRWSARDSSAID